MQRISNPFPIFLDQRGALIDAGYIYVGAANTDPEVSPLSTFWDAARTIPATQPLRTSGGMLVNGGTPSFVYIAEDDYSIRVRDADGVQVVYVPSSVAAGTAYQPLDSDLTAIAMLGTSAFGRSLLTLANAAALASATGLPASLPIIGGTITGNITRSGSGVHLYHNDAALTSGRVFLTVTGAGDPTSLAGDIWFSY